MPKDNKMKLSIHFITSLVLSAIFYPFYGIASFAIMSGGFLIDVDHILPYFFKFKSLDFKKAYTYYMSTTYEKHQGLFFTFHSIELLLAGIFFSFRYDLALMFSIGLLVHYILDLIDEMKIAGHLVKSWSFILWLKKRTAEARN